MLSLVFYTNIMWIERLCVRHLSYLTFLKEYYSLQMVAFEIIKSTSIAENDFFLLFSYAAGKLLELIYCEL